MARIRRGHERGAYGGFIGLIEITFFQTDKNAGLNPDAAPAVLYLFFKNPF